MRAPTIPAVCGMLLMTAVHGISAQQQGGRERPITGEQVQETLVGRGVRVWTQNCIRCHNIRHAVERTDRGWAMIVAHMRARANLTKREAEAVVAFLQSVNQPPAEGEEMGAGGERQREEAECPARIEGLVLQGSTIFHGKGNCAHCHGSNGQGGVGPALTDASKWARISGSYASIVSLVHSGAPGMPPKGGADLTDAEVCAVGAFVYSISHR